MKEIFQHFRPEEKETIIKLNSRFEIAERDFYPVLLDFLDPREQSIVQSLSGYYPDLKIEFYGGGESRERMRAMLIPEMLEVSKDDFEVMVLELDYPEKFVNLDHRNILGAIMSVGLDRNLIGDIVIGETIQFAIARPYFHIFETELTTIKNAPVILNEVPHAEFMDNVDDGVPQMILISSFRLDTVTGELLKEGRTKSKNRIEKGKVKVNHTVVVNPAFILEEDDVVSVRHFGRYKIDEMLHETKKGKYRIKAKVYKSK